MRRAARTDATQGDIVVSTAFRFILPWPPKELSPNARRHYHALARSKKAYREACAWTAKQQGAVSLKPGTLLNVHLEFVPPDRRHRDWDNMLAACKAGLDGLADVIGVDDHFWRISFNVADEIGGMVRVRVDSMGGVLKSCTGG